MRTLAGRRPELVFLAALMVFVLMLTLRALRDQPSAPLAIDTAAPAPASLGDEQVIAGLQERIRTNPDDTRAYAQLGLALMQRIRETADPTLYGRAEAAFAAALKRDPQLFEALIGQGQL